MTTDLTALLDRFIEVSEGATPGRWYIADGSLPQHRGVVSSLTDFVTDERNNNDAIVAWRQLAVPLAKVAKAARELREGGIPHYQKRCIDLDVALAELAKAAEGDEIVPGGVDCSNCRHIEESNKPKPMLRQPKTTAEILAEIDRRIAYTEDYLSVHGRRSGKNLGTMALTTLKSLRAFITGEEGK